MNLAAHLRSVRRLSKSAKSQVTFALHGAMIRADKINSVIVMLPKLVYFSHSVYSYTLPQGGTVSAPSPVNVNIQRTHDTRHALRSLWRNRSIEKRKGIESGGQLGSEQKELWIKLRKVHVSRVLASAKERKHDSETQDTKQKRSHYWTVTVVGQGTEVRARNWKEIYNNNHNNSK